MYGYRLIQQLGPNAPLPILPARVPREVVHLEMQLPRAVVHTLPKGIDPKTITRGREDLLINQITITFQRFIREEGNVGIDAVFPGPDFQNCIKIKSSKKLRSLIAYLFRTSPERENAHYLFCLHKPGQLVTEGHVFYVHLKEGIILDARFGPFLWKIEQAALPHFKSLLISYLKTNYEKWDLLACRIKQEPATLYSKLPVIARSALTQSKIVVHLAHKVGSKEARQMACTLPGIAMIAHYFQKREHQAEEFRQGIRNIDHNLSLTSKFKEYEKLALKYEQFSGIEWDMNCHLIAPWTNLNEVDWSEIFKTLDHLDPRLHSLNSRIHEELFGKAYDILKKTRSNKVPPEKKQTYLELSYSIAFELLERRKNLVEKYSLNLMVSIIAYNAPDAEKLLEILLIYGADPDGDEYSSPLYDACEHGYVNLVKLLLKYGANLSHPKYIHDHRLSHALKALAKKNPEAAAEIEKLLQGPFPSHGLENRHSYLLD